MREGGGREREGGGEGGEREALLCMASCTYGEAWMFRMPNER